MSSVNKWVQAGSSATALLTAALQAADDDGQLVRDLLPVFEDMDRNDLAFSSAWLARIAIASLLHQYGSVEAVEEAIQQMALEITRIDLENSAG